ncbi:substrate-binding domain-containing protein [Saccharothrix sp. Mg75]|uniref:substrate-binding domain-containing protein n=1 Tax=Saccharothrix sp. Mg75 TaxID=3445357 RepID=UPI003EECDFB2
MSPRPGRGVSTADVARLAGVSAQTASRVPNGRASVVGTTGQQVLDAVRQPGYRPNSAARALEHGEFRTIGVILFTLSTQDGVLDAFTRPGEPAVDPACTAVFTANDQMALGLLRAFHERGRTVPGDVSLVGFDDIPDSASFIPPLTTVHQDFTEVGGAAWSRCCGRCGSSTRSRGRAWCPRAWSCA